MSVLLTEVSVYVLQVAEGKLGRVGLLTESQVADALFYRITTRGGREGERGRKGAREGVCMKHLHSLEYELVALNAAFGGGLRR